MFIREFLFALLPEVDDFYILYLAILNIKPNTGTIRETFFLNQLKNHHHLSYPENGDFSVDSNYIFEVGGKNKSNLQIQDIPNAYLAVDDIQTGFGTKIPLWLFGFLY